MKKALSFCALTLALFAVVFSLGPVPPVDTQLSSVQLPADLNRYLAESEARYPDITPGAEKTIVWAHPDQRQTDLAIIYLHGYSATRQETAPLSEQLAEQLGANLFATRLNGHGRSGAAMAEASVHDWLQDSQEALQIGQRLGKQVLVIGTSTGATLATWLALQGENPQVLAYIMVSPNFAPKDPAATVLTWPWASHFVPLLLGPEHQWQPRNAEQARYWSHRYPVQALLPMMALVKYVREQPLEQISTPILTLYSQDDQVVSAPAIEAAFARFGSPHKQLIALKDTQDPSHHVLAGEILSPSDTARVNLAIMQFLKALPGLPSISMRNADSQ
ncbi:alpha/beta fold hydrolase [Pseudomonas sp. 1928-m]|uniref:alpha/beta hydrolase n=1 Tax=Pseudomonas sp. 1928-m TaxID=3033804 RepID=UPI0023DF9EF0|nr:alpha/beta fold hydrolase [Pseudomonas sp. 1928-m]MDF3193654.1 alpha/beta fold hydrolase [Pseudomonas sp. 1928-m]